jgi:hypothetical protein
MKTPHQSPTKRRKGSRRHVALHTESPVPDKVEELYWFAMALTGDPDVAAKLVVDAGNVTATDSAARLPIDSPWRQSSRS